MNPLRARERRVLVVGASSQVGWFLLPRLLARGLAVDALSRTAPVDYPSLEGLRWVTPDTAQEMLDSYEALLSAGPLALALDYARAMPGLQRLCLTSTSSVLVKAQSPDLAERDAVEAIREAEESFRQLARERNLPLLLLRPTLVYGCGLDRNLTRLVAFIERFGFLPLSRRAGGLRQPLHADDLARALAAGLEPRARRELVSPLCGGEALDYRAMMRRLFHALDRPPRLLALPPALFAGGVALARRLGLASELSPEMVGRQAVNLIFEDARAREILGVQPRRFHPTAKDFQRPAPDVLQRIAAPL